MKSFSEAGVIKHYATYIVVVRHPEEGLLNIIQVEFLINKEFKLVNFLLTETRAV